MKQQRTKRTWTCKEIEAQLRTGKLRFRNDDNVVWWGGKGKNAFGASASVELYLCGRGLWGRGVPKVQMLPDKRCEV
jgi:hypothetical protein